VSDAGGDEVRHAVSGFLDTPAGCSTPQVQRGPVTAWSQTATASEAARWLAEWRAELGYLQLADAVQMLTDAFGDRFVSPAASGRCRIRCDVLAALHGLAPGMEWTCEVDCWESSGAALPPRPP
jgi:hypothetical protein